MEPLGNFLSVPTPVVLQDGRCFVVSPLTEADLLGLMNRIQQNRLSMFLRAIPPELPEKERLKMAKAAMQEAAAFNPENVKILDKEEIALFIFLSMKKKNAITLEQVREICENPEDLNSILTVLNGGTEEIAAQKKTKRGKNESLSAN